MRSLIHHPLSLLILTLAPACGEKHSLGELTGTGVTASTTESTDSTDGASSTDGTGSTDSTGKPLDTTDGPVGTASSSATTDGPVGTASSSATEGDDPCAQWDDEAACKQAGCYYTKGMTLVTDAGGCHWGEPIGYCVGDTAGSDAPAMYCTPGPEPVPVVFPFDPFILPEGWTECGCEGAPLAASCYEEAFNVDFGCTALEDHCAALADQASCDQFQGDAGLNGCLWVETTIEVAVNPACNAGPPVGRCIPVRLREAGEKCPSLDPPMACGQDDADKLPYFAPVDGAPTNEKLELIADVPCEFVPLLDFELCWNGGSSPSGCECACSP